MKFTCRVCGGYMMACTDGLRCGACSRKIELHVIEVDTEPAATRPGLLAQIIDPREELNNQRRALEGRS